MMHSPETRCRMQFLRKTLFRRRRVDVSVARDNHVPAGRASSHSITLPRRRLEMLLRTNRTLAAARTLCTVHFPISAAADSPVVAGRIRWTKNEANHDAQFRCCANGQVPPLWSVRTHAGRQPVHMRRASRGSVHKHQADACGCKTNLTRGLSPHILS